LGIFIKEKVNKKQQQADKKRNWTHTETLKHSKKEKTNKEKDRIKTMRSMTMRIQTTTTNRKRVA